MSENDWMEWMDEEKRAELMEKRRQVGFEDAHAYEDYAIARVGRPPRLRVKDGEITPKYMCNFSGWKRLMHAFGSDDMEFVQGLVCQMARAGRGDGKVDEQTLNFMVSFVIGLKPKDQMEATLMTEAAMTHVVKMELAGRIDTSNLDARQINANLVIKFGRTFVSQMEVLKRYRSGGEQKCAMPHVQINDHAQAIVNSIVHGPAGASSEDVNEYERALTHSPAQPMPDPAEPAPSLYPIEDERRKRTSKRTR